MGWRVPYHSITTTRLFYIQSRLEFRMNYIIYTNGENTAITKSLEVAHTFTLKLIEMGYNAKYERVTYG